MGNQLFRPLGIVLCAIITGLAPVYCQEPAPHDKPPAAPVKMHYDEDARTWYSVSVNDQLLEVHLQIADSIQQTKVVENGLELWVDPRGKKNKTTGIVYPLAMAKPPAQKSAASAGALPALPQGEEPIDKNNRKTPRQSLPPLIALQREMKLVGFGDALNGTQNQHHPSGIDVALHLANDTLYYDARIPLNLLAGLQGAGSHISIGIIEKGKNPSEFKGDMPGGPGGPGGPPPGGDGIGPGGPPPPGEDINQEMMEMFINNVIWYRINTGR